MLNRRRVLVGAGAAVVVLALLIYWFTRPDPVAVRLAAVDRGLVQFTVANTRAGTVMACQRARMAPAAAGSIDSLPVTEGDRVEAGQILLELWNDDLQAQLELARREHTAAGARAEQACIRAAVAVEEADRQLALHKRGIASEERMRRMVAEGKASRAACEAAREAGRVAEAKIDVTNAALEKTRLRAPFAGIVAEVNGELGEFVTPSPVGVATLPTIDLIDTSCLYVSAPIDEVDAGGVRTDLPAHITLDAFGDRRLKGRLRRVAPYVLDLEKQARTVDVEVDFIDLDPALSLLVGYSADIEIVLAMREDTLRVPTEAVLEGYRVLVYEDGVLESRTFEAGLSNWRFTEVTTGLEEGVQVVLSVDREGAEAGARAEPEDPDDE